LKGRKTWIDDGIDDEEDVERGNLMTILSTGK